MKRVIWDKMALETIRSFSVNVRKEIGTLLRLLQEGEILSMPQSKSVKQLATSAFELRVKDKDGTYRVFYVLFDKYNIFIPHAFIKKNQKIPIKEIEIARKRLRRLINENK